LTSFFEDEDVEKVCNKCSCSTAEMKHNFLRLPRILVLHLKRFKLDSSAKTFTKITDKISMPTSIDLGNYCTDKTRNPIPFNLSEVKSSKIKVNAQKNKVQPNSSSVPLTSNNVNAQKHKVQQNPSPVTLTSNKENIDSNIQQTNKKRPIEIDQQTQNTSSKKRKVEENIHSSKKPKDNDKNKNITKPETSTHIETSAEDKETWEFGDSLNDDDLKKVLELSKKESELMDEDLKLAMEQSLKESEAKGITSDFEDDGNKENNVQTTVNTTNNVNSDEPSDDSASDFDLNQPYGGFTATFVNKAEETDMNDSDSTQPMGHSDNGMEFEVEVENDSPPDCTEDYTEKDLVEEKGIPPSPAITTYKLKAVVHHRGFGVSSGHYVSDIYYPKINKWKNYNDDKVTEITVHQALEQAEQQRNSYIFFYIHTSCLETENKKP